MNDFERYWINLAQASDARVNAACEATGTIGYYLGPYCSLSDAERLAGLREALLDLRGALGLSFGPAPATADVPQQKGRES